MHTQVKILNKQKRFSENKERGEVYERQRERERENIFSKKGKKDYFLFSFTQQNTRTLKSKLGSNKEKPSLPPTSFFALRKERNVLTGDVQQQNREY